MEWYCVGKFHLNLKIAAAALCLALLTSCAAAAETVQPPPPADNSPVVTAGGVQTAPDSNGETGSGKASGSRTASSSGTNPAALSGATSSSGSSSAPPAASSAAAASSSGFSSSSSSSPSVTGSSAFVKSSSSAAVSPPFSHPAKVTAAYYGGWSAYSGFTPDKISGSSLDILHYAFAEISADLRVVPSDPYIDGKNFTLLKSLKSRYPGLRTVISIGGWSDSRYFSDAALTSSSRASFAESAVSFMKANGFDGIDIDWEYPTGGGLSSNVTRPEDKTNFGLLLGALRVRLDAQGARDNKHYILSFAGGAGSGYAAGVGLAGIAKTVDYGIIMTYDLHGNWDAYTDFNAPLYTPEGQSPQDRTSVDDSVRAWLNHGFPAGKLMMGVPFYGYAYQGVSSADNGLWQRFSTGRAVGFDSIRSNYLSNGACRVFFHSTAQVPWLYGNSVFVSYDDEASIRRKAQYAVSKGLLGVGAWELGFDKNAVLLRTVKSALG